MFRIDFIGVPGCGKTTLVNQTIKLSKSGRVIKLSHARKIVLSQGFSSYHSKAYNKMVSSSFITRLRYRFFFRQDRVKLKSFLLEKVSKFEPLLHTILMNVSESHYKSSSYLKIKRLGWFIGLLEDSILVSEYKLDRVVLCDESLTSKLFQMDFLLNIDEDLKERSDELFPDAIVCVLCDEQDLIERLYSRSKITLAHSKGLSDIEKDEITAMQRQVLRVAEKMREKGVPTLMVNSSNSIQTCLEAISGFIRDFKNYE